MGRDHRRAWPSPRPPHPRCLTRKGRWCCRAVANLQQAVPARSNTRWSTGRRCPPVWSARADVRDDMCRKLAKHASQPHPYRCGGQRQRIAPVRCALDQPRPRLLRELVPSRPNLTDILQIGCIQMARGKVLGQKWNLPTSVRPLLQTFGLPAISFHPGISSSISDIDSSFHTLIVDSFACFGNRCHLSPSGPWGGVFGSIPQTLTAVGRTDIPIIGPWPPIRK